MHQVFRERLVPWLDSVTSSVVEWVWDYEGRGQPDDVEGLLERCDRVVDTFTALAENEPPAAWQSKPLPPAVTWTALSNADQAFLNSALSAARQACPSVRLLLFGSRAAGSARPNSDYDLLFVFPDAVPLRQYDQRVSDVVALARRLGIQVDILHTSESEWINPSIPSRPLIRRIEACHIEVR
jgi:predicted nucleotidyltransferase